MYLFLEKVMRGEVSSISKRYRKASNKYLKSSDPRQESKHIIYLDANNLYNNVVSKFPPTNRFKWIDSKGFNLNKYTRNSSKGCILKVDREYPEEFDNCTMIILWLWIK